MNMLLFVWLSIIISCHADSGDGDSGDGDGFLLFGDNFEANVFDFFPGDDPDICPCTPRGAICDILATCVRDANGRDLACLGGEFIAIDFLFCGNDPFTDPQAPPILDALFTPLFAIIPTFLISEDINFGVCVSSFDGIAGVIRAIIENIEDLIEEFESCDFRRRLQDGTTDPTDPAPNPNPNPNPIHGSVVTFENFVELLEWNGKNRQEVMELIFKPGGIGQLVAMMKQGSAGSTTRRLLDSGDGDDFGICDFLWIYGPFGGGDRRRRLSIEDMTFDPATHPLEDLIATILTSGDCENDRDSTPIPCIIKDVLNNYGGRRRLESGSGESGEDGDDFFNFGCCGDIETSIQFTTVPQASTCAAQIEDAAECLGNTFAAGLCGEAE